MNLFNSLESFFALEIDPQEATLINWRQRVFSMLLSTATPLIAIVYLFSMVSQIRQGQWGQVGVNTFTFLWVITATYYKRLPYLVRVWSVLILLFTLGISTALSKATVGDGRIWLLAASILAAVFLGGRAGLIIAGVNFLTWLGIGFLYRIYLLPYPAEHLSALIEQGNFSLWLNTGLTSLLVGSVIVLSLAVMLNNLNTTLQRSQTLTNELEEKTDQLTDQTETLTRHSHSLEASAQISQSIAAILDPDQLLYTAARMIYTSFDMLHVGIFLINPARDEVVLRASSGGGGKIIPTLGYRLPLREGLIGWVTEQSRSRTASTHDEATQPPLRVKLSNARSHAVLPMQTRDELLGVIVVQSQNPNTFDPNTVTTLQILADQIGTLLHNAQLFAERETALESERRAYRDLARSTWKEYIQSQAPSGYRHDQEGIKPLDPTDATQRQPISSDPDTWSVPIQVRGQVIGYIDVQKQSGAQWSSAERDMLQTLTDRLESALDSARLYQETQQRAVHDRIVSDVTARIRETLDMETILKTATSEIQQILDLAEAEIRLDAEPYSTDQSK